MTDQEKITAFKEHLAKLLRVDPSEVTDEKRLATDFFMTSMHYYGMISKIKQLSGKKLTYPELKKCETVGDIAKLIISE